MTITPGTRLGPYEIVVSIGAGGMGEVFRARDTRLQRDVALKVLPDSFRRATRSGSRASSAKRRRWPPSRTPTCSASTTIGTERAITYAVTELLEGQTLRERLADGRAAGRKAVDFASQIARGARRGAREGASSTAT